LKPLNGLTAAKRLRKKTEAAALDVPTEEKSRGLSSLAKSSELQPSPLLENLLEMNQPKPMKRTQYGKNHIPKKFSQTSSNHTTEE
jgi:hypothetical protein